MTIERLDPPAVADEVSMLRGFLDHFRRTLRRQVQGLDAAQLATRLEPSTMTLGGLVKHLTYVEQWWFEIVLHGREQRGFWADVDWSADQDWDWNSATENTPEELDAMLADQITMSDAALEEALAEGGLDRLAERSRRGRQVSLRWIMIHMIEEYARHCGHADLIRESVDGATDL